MKKILLSSTILCCSFILSNAQDFKISFVDCISCKEHGIGINIEISLRNLTGISLMSKSSFESQMRNKGFSLHYTELNCIMAYQQMPFSSPKYDDLYTFMKKCDNLVSVSWTGLSNQSGFRKILNILEDEGVSSSYEGGYYVYRFAVKEDLFILSYKRENKSDSYETLIIESKRN